MKLPSTLEMKLSVEDFAIAEEVTRLAETLWAKSVQFMSANDSPAIYSVMMFKRNWSAHRGFLLLSSEGLEIEASIVLRSGLEAAICLCANFVLRDEFVALMRMDAAETLKRQVNMWRDRGDLELAKIYETSRSEIMDRMRSGSKSKALDWGDLARKGGALDLYNEYRRISGQVAHVTGLSILRGVVGPNFEGKDRQDELVAIEKPVNFILNTATTLRCCRLHSIMIEEVDLVRAAERLLLRLDTASKLWFPA